VCKRTTFGTLEEFVEERGRDRCGEGECARERSGRERKRVRTCAETEERERERERERTCPSSASVSDSPSSDSRASTCWPVRAQSFTPGVHAMSRPWNSLIASAANDHLMCGRVDNREGGAGRQGGVAVTKAA